MSNTIQKVLSNLTELQEDHFLEARMSDVENITFPNQT